MAQYEGRQTSVAKKVIASFVIGLLFMGIVIAFISQISVDRGLKKYAKKELEASQQLFTQTIYDQATELENDLDWIMVALLDKTEEEQKHYLSTGVFGQNKKFDTMSFISLDKSVRLNSGKITYPIPDWFIDNVRSKNSFTSIVGSDTEIYLLTGVNCPDKYGNVVGTLYLKRTLSTQEFIEDLKNDTKREITLYNHYVRAYTTIPHMAGTEISDKSLIDRAEKGETLFTTTRIEGIDYSCCYFPIINNEGMMFGVAFMGTNMTNINQTRNSVVLALISFTFLAAVLIILSAIILLRVILVKPLWSLGRAFRNLNSGKADLTYRLPVKGNDEFARISTDFNTFIDNLAGIVRQIESTQNSLKKIGTELGESSVTSANGTTEILANIESVRLRSREQSENVAKTSKCNRSGN